MKKGLITAIILSFVISFMLFIFEPITMYANNIDDFWFDLYTLIKPTLLLFSISFVGLSVFFLIMYFIAKKTKKSIIFNISLYLAGFGFLCAYIHSNFLAGFLPSLDGTTIEWGGKAANISSIAVCIVVAALFIVGHIKLGGEKTVKYSSYAYLAVFAMLSVSLLSTCLTTPVFEAKKVLNTSTVDELYTVSTNRNYFILLLDAVDSQAFNKVVQKKDEYKAIFKDFSYYPDTLSGYAFTRDSIPFIFSGIWNENQEQFDKYSTRAFSESKFFNTLAEQNWQRDFYEYEYTWHNNKALDFNNIVSVVGKPSTKVFMKEELKYILFKTLPFPLKRFSKIDTMEFEKPQSDNDAEPFAWDNLDFYNGHLDRTAETTDNKLFQFYHLDGGHVPFDLDENLNELPDEDGTYPQKLEAALKVADSFLKYLKKNNAYENATIVVMADHGFWFEGTDRQNPILYIKGPNEKHDKMIVSEKQVSYADLCDTFTELLDRKKSTEIFSNLPTDGRVRRYLYNEFLHEDHMEEYEQTGKAWETSTFKPTGRSYDL